MPSAQTQSPPASRTANGDDGESTPIISAEHGSRRDYQAVSPESGPQFLEAAAPLSPRKSRGSAANEQRGVAQASDNGDQPPASDSLGGKDESSWFRRTLDKYGAIELDNKGSVARDHLALERTFLAWLRTSLSFASIGIAITQLFRLNTTITDREGLTPKPGQGGTSHLRQMGKPLGATFLGISILILLVGWRRYFESQHWIIEGKFPASRGSIVLVTGITGALIVASLAVVVSVGATQFEKRHMDG